MPHGFPLLVVCYWNALAHALKLEETKEPRHQPETKAYWNYCSSVLAFNRQKVSLFAMHAKVSHCKL